MTALYFYYHFNKARISRNLSTSLEEPSNALIIRGDPKGVRKPTSGINRATSHFATIVTTFSCSLSFALSVFKSGVTSTNPIVAEYSANGNIQAESSPNLSIRTVFSPRTVH